jgi:hypothetical protein
MMAGFLGDQTKLTASSLLRRRTGICFGAVFKNQLQGIR